MRRPTLLVFAAACVLAATAAAARPPAVMRVAATGSTGHISGSAQFFSYGVALRNRSKTRDAMGVRVRVFVLGDAGLVGVYITKVPFIPAGSTFYLGNEPVAMTSVQRAVGIRVVLSTGGTRPKQGSLPVASASAPSGRTIRGVVHNRYRHAILTARSRLYAVYYGRTGKIVGGDRLKGVSFAGKHRIEPRTSARFTAHLGPAVPASSIAAVRVSVDPVLAP